MKNNIKHLNMNLIHYGAKSFDPLKFNRVKNRPSRSKPYNGTGFWASPVDSELGWINYCELHATFIDKGIYFNFNYSGNTYVIDDMDSLLSMPWVHGSLGSVETMFVDYESMDRDGIDGVFLSFKGMKETILYDFSSGQELDQSTEDWDCESILILNPDCIIN